MPPKKKSKSKVLEPEPEYEEEEIAMPPPPIAPGDADLDDEGITRCVCGKADEEGGTWMIQCETCKVWQHGICVGYQEENECPDTYYCEMCRPDLHEALLRNRKNAGHSRLTTIQPGSHDYPHHLSTSGHPHVSGNIAGAASTSMSRSSRSPTPLAARSNLPKRRNTLNSREAAYEEALERGDIDALNKIAATQEEEAAAAGNASKRKRKKSGGTTSEDAARSSPTPGSVTSERPSAFEADGFRDVNDGTASATGSVKADNTSRKGKRNKKEKEASMDIDIDDTASNLSASHGGLAPPKKHANQYTYRGKPVNPATVTPSKQTGGRNAGSAAPEVSASGGPSRKGNAGTSHKASQHATGGAAPPSPHQPVSISWGLPDHLSHLSDLLPSPLQAPIDVPIGPNESVQERGAKVKWPQKRTTIGEMRRRVRAMLDYTTKAQVDVTERAKRTASLDNFIKKAAEMGLEGVGVAPNNANGKGKGKADAGVDYELITTIANLPEVLEPVLEPSPPISVSTSLQGTSAGSTTGATPLDFSTLTTAQLLASLTQDLLNFQEKFGAGLGGKVYREAVPRERRPRGAAAAAIAAMERSE